LKKWQTKEEYLNASHPIMDGYVYRTFPAESIHWSPFEGEESVLYGINTTTNKVVRIDVDRPAGQQVTEIASYALDQAGATEAERSGNTSDTYGAGWTKDNRFTVVYVDKKGTTHGGVFLDVQKRSATYFDKIPAFTRKPAKPSDNEAWRGFPHRSSQHGGRSPSGKYMAIYAGSMNEGGDGVVNTYDGSFIKDGEVNFGNPASPVYPYNAMYVSWRADDAWFIVTSLGDSECRLVDGKRRWINLEKGEKPALWPNGIFQVYADTAAGVCRYRKLLTYYTTGHWTNTYKTGPSAGKSFSDSNYHAHGIPALRNDGRQLVYCAHENNYSTTDLAHAAAAGIDTAYMQGRVSGIGLFLVELKTAGE
jgi:hypothetical protein